jgi:hypothetical protein
MSISETVAFQQHHITVIQVKNICSCCIRLLLLEYSFEQETLKREIEGSNSLSQLSLFLINRGAFKSCYMTIQNPWLVATNRRPTCMELGQNYHNTPCLAKKMTSIEGYSPTLNGNTSPQGQLRFNLAEGKRVVTLIRV